LKKHPDVLSLSRSDPLYAYVHLANRLFENTASERDLPAITLQLPPLNQNILNKLAQQAEDAALTEPRRGWAITHVADAAANSQSCDLFARSMAAWYLGRACNHWGQPKQATTAISRAREGFMVLSESGWTAACDWQLNALTWTKPDFVQAAEELKRALGGLEYAGFDGFVPHCRLTLAYAQVLIGESDEAKENIQVSEAIFIAQGDILNQARCWQNEASRLRRLGQYDDSLGKLENAMEVFKSEGALLDIAMVYYQFALLHLLRTDDFTKAISYFEQAAQIYAICDLDLWQAACTTNLGAIYMQIGQLAKADELLRKSRESFTRHNVLGLLADNLNDSGKLNTLRGLPSLSIEQYIQAIEVYKKLGARLPAAIYTANLGEAYGLLGRYQDALHYLEKATEFLMPLKNYFRLGTCEKYAAIIWSRLGQPSLAHEHLDRAAEYYEGAKQRALLSSIYNTRANIFFEQGEQLKAIDCLGKSLEIAEIHGTRPQAALAKRLLGEALIRIGCYEDARGYLEQALLSFSEMGMTMERVSCLIALGIYYAQASETNKASNSFQEALQKSEGAFPELDWRAYVGLANLAETRGDIMAAIDSYSRGEEALSRVRLNFWQPALVGSYLQTPSVVFNKAVILATKAKVPQSTLQFVEANKATTLLRQLLMAGEFSLGVETQELNDLRAEINWLQDQLRVSLDKTAPIQFAFRSRQTRVQLAEKVKRYDSLMARIERQERSDQVTQIQPKFILTLFRELANKALGDSWVVLDYFALDDQIISIEISSDRCELHSSPISNRFLIALEECLKSRQGGTIPTQSDLDVLGNVLIPMSTVEHLTPDTFLIISPHRKLHNVPWAAIRSGSNQPLVCRCIPHVVPSLQNLVALWERDLPKLPQSRDSGLLVGISHFKGKFRDLPFVKDEIHSLQSRLGSASQLLSESEVTWENITKLCHRARGSENKVDGLSRFAWLHVASHIFADPHTGRSSGIAMWDGDIWLDQLRDLAPLPRLVTFSACNSIYSFVYEGDEHIGLATTCLVSGASTVVGSIWPIIDRSSAEFMIGYYDFYLSGMHPAQAVSQTQRLMISRGEQVNDWAGFICLGLP
jgi:tetratricopeptide (TPR) repeat protein